MSSKPEFRPDMDEVPVWHAPFTDEQIAALEAWQASPYVHSYTCGAEHAELPIGHRSPDLIPTRDGWVCRIADCQYRQTWAHGWHDRKQIESLNDGMAHLFGPLPDNDDAI